MPTGARLGFGTQLQMGDGATPTENFTTISELVEIGTPSFQRDTVDATHHGSSGGVREFISGLVDPGEVALTMNWLPNDATQDHSTGLLAAALDGVARNYKLIIPSSPAVTWNFRAIVTNFSGATPMDDKMTATATMKVSGLPTFS